MPASGRCRSNPPWSLSAGRKKFILIIRLAAGSEPLVKRRRQYRHRHAFINRRLDRPAAFARVGDAAGKLRKLRIFNQRTSRQVEEPGRNDTPPPPDFGHLAKI